MKNTQGKIKLTSAEAREFRKQRGMFKKIQEETMNRLPQEDCGKRYGFHYLIPMLRKFRRDMTNIYEYKSKKK